MQDRSTDAKFDKPIEIETGPHPRAAVIWLHGLGADGQDFVPVVPELGIRTDCPVRFIFPHASRMPVTCNGGYVMRAWYDIVSIDDAKRHADKAGIEASCAYVASLIQEQNARGIATNRIVIAGFSQGCAIAYTVGLTYPQTLGGVVALSGYVPAPDLIDARISEASRATPIFAAHGSADGVVSLALGEQGRDLAGKWGAALEWRVYAMEHSVCLEELRDIGRWLNQRFADGAVPSASPV